ncbi:MAG: hypothetical protein ACPLZG_11125, partial [Thermoproteota archaeon]
ENNLVFAKKEESKKESFYMLYSYCDKVYEENVRVNIMKGTADSTSAILLSARYTSGRTITLSADVFWFSLGEWNVGGSFGLSSSESSPGYPSWVTSAVPQGSTGYISMVATYRIEEWIYQEPDGTIEDKEYLAYWARFYPSTMSNLKGEDEVSVNYNWLALAYGNGLSAGDPPMYNDGTGSSSSFTISAPVWSFLCSVAGAWPGFNTAALVADLIFSLNVKSSSTTAMDLLADFWGQAGHAYGIYRGVSKFGGITAVYYKVQG